MALLTYQIRRFSSQSLCMRLHFQHAYPGAVLKFVLMDYFKYSICTLQYLFMILDSEVLMFFFWTSLDELTFFPREEVEGMQHFTDQDYSEILNSMLPSLSVGHVPRRAGGNLGCNWTIPICQNPGTLV